ncbi:MAG: nucleotidyltransferase family protein [Pseudomonadota bacterium]|nr:nucleotidyltransferase family protein [Pseudomonadota bacterium]
MKIGALVLAAGFSKRFGRDKRIETLHEDEPMVIKTIANLVRHFEEIIVVLRSNDQTIADLILNKFGAAKIILHHAKDSIEGMGHSLASAITTVNQRKWDSAFIFLGDMPYLESETISRLKNEATFYPSQIIVPKFGTATGHPVCFPNRFYRELGFLSGDMGAKRIVHSNLECVRFIKTNDRGVTLDIDTLSDIV